MKKWVLKAIVQKAISVLPASQRINYLAQKHITKGVYLSDQYFEDKLTHAIDHISYCKRYNIQPSFAALELGSGWYPVVPLALFLAGAERVVSIDISPLMTKEGIIDTISKFLEWRKSGRLEKLNPFTQPERWEILEKIPASVSAETEMLKLLEELKLQLLVKDARNTGFPDEEFDVICSNNTFEHIYPQVLRPILLEFQRILKPGGIMSHFIDMSDHFAHLDRSITIYNFLKFSKTQWKTIDNNVQPQNRWRLRDYENIYTELDIPIAEKKIRPGSIEEVEKIEVHKEFQNYTSEDLAISHAHLVSRKN